MKPIVKKQPSLIDKKNPWKMGIFELQTQEIFYESLNLILEEFLLKTDGQKEAARLSQKESSYDS